MDRRHVLQAMGAGLASSCLSTFATTRSTRFVAVGVGGAGRNLTVALRASGALNQPGVAVDYLCVDADPRTNELIDLANVAEPTLPPIKTVSVSLDSFETSGRASPTTLPAGLSHHLSGADAVFLLVGMGNRTGTAITPILARIARQGGSSIVAVAVTPFAFEGERVQIAAVAIEALRHEADGVIVFSNDDHARQCGDDTPLLDVFDSLDRRIAASLRKIAGAIVPQHFSSEYRSV